MVVTVKHAVVPAKFIQFVQGAMNATVVGIAKLLAILISAYRANKVNVNPTAATAKIAQADIVNLKNAAPANLA